MDAQLFDNPLWYMHSHDFAEYATGSALAKRCDPNVLPVAAIADHSEAAFADLAKLFKVGEGAIILEADPPLAIPGFALTDQFSADQLICQQRTPIPEMDVQFIELTQPDLQDAIQLVELTQPGPFIPGLFARRRFVGIRQAGHLVAMAGERMIAGGYAEISGVCTHPDWRGKGYGRFLTCVIADGIWERGEIPFLTVYPTNVSAYRIYVALHFVKRGGLIGYMITRI
jgi:ribosomal protein S18 acetylase RimI-like enzyme